VIALFVWRWHANIEATPKSAVAITEISEFTGGDVSLITSANRLDIDDGAVSRTDDQYCEKTI
jgi:hypothetical protein